jgi:hypothetical protein
VSLCIFLLPRGFPGSLRLFRPPSPAECMGGCSMHGGACVDSLGGLFCVRSFFLAGVLPPSFPWEFIFLVPARLVPFWCVGASLSCI